MFKPYRWSILNFPPQFRSDKTSPILSILRPPSGTVSKRLEMCSLPYTTSWGQTVRQLVKGYTHAGNHRVVWDGTSQDGSSVAAGIYFYQLRTGDVSVVRKMLLLDGGGSFTALHHLTEQISVAKTLANTAAETEYILAVKCDGYVTYEDYDFTVSTDTRVDIALEEKHGVTIYGLLRYNPCTGCKTDNWNGIIDPINIIVYDTSDYTEKLANIYIDYPDTTVEITGLPVTIIDVVVQGDDIISTKQSEIQLSDGEDTWVNLYSVNILYNMDITVGIDMMKDYFSIQLKTAFDDSLTAVNILEEYNCALNLFRKNEYTRYSYVCEILKTNHNNPVQMVQMMNNDHRIYTSYPNYLIIVK